MVSHEPAENEKVVAVDRWLKDVSEASRHWKTVKAAQQSTERIVVYLEEIRTGVHGASPELEARMEEAIVRNRANASDLADAAIRLSELEGSFYGIVSEVSPPEVAEAWRMRCIEHKTWLQCSLALHYNRQHLERLSKRAKLAVYGLLPGEYRDGE